MGVTWEIVVEFLNVTKYTVMQFSLEKKNLRTTCEME